MATMFPESTSVFTSEGEKVFYNFLSKVARPDSQILAWYEPDISGREPDFILFSPDCGLIVFEVKDWRIEQILEANPKEFRLRCGAHDEPRKNPQAQAREYVKELLTRIARDQSEAKQSPGKSPVPITEGVVLPFITKFDFLEAKLDQVIPVGKIIFWDDLHELSPFWSDPSGALFRTWLQEKYPPLFSFLLSPRQTAWLRAMLFPIVRINLPHRAGAIHNDNESVIQALDHCQEQLARNFTQGKQLVTGPSGSGKTLILAHQAWHLPRANPKIKKILFTCFNLSLPGYIRRLLARKHVPMGENGVEVISIYDLCERILGERLAHSKEQTDYYELVVQEALEALSTNPETDSWDAILVDEGQDFTPEMAQLLLKLLHPKHGVLTIALDENQSIYTCATRMWENLGIHGLTVFRLAEQYRSSRNIADLGVQLFGARPHKAREAAQSGNEPKVKAFPDQQRLLEEIAAEIAQRVQDGIPMSEIAVLYTNTKLKDGSLLPVQLIKLLENKGVLAEWPAEDERAKRRFDITSDTVKISTIHSVKGMDFGHVFLIGLDDLKDYADGKNRRLAYAGITRARHELFIAYVENRGMIPALKP